MSGASQLGSSHTVIAQPGSWKTRVEDGHAYVVVSQEDFSSIVDESTENINSHTTVVVGTTTV